MNRALLATLGGAALIGAGTAPAEPTRVIVSIENLAPVNGTAQTPHWVGFHDGVGFDIYDGGTPANSRPLTEDPIRSVERLAEDGNTEPLAQNFEVLQPGGVDGMISGPGGALLPGQIGSASFLLDSLNPFHRFFSYASMVLPSNDFWYANGNPQSHPVFDENGNFVAQDFFVTRDDILDAGTELNSEIPAETAFFGQTVADTGGDENGVIRDFDPTDPQTFFQRPGSGGVLDSPQFRMADFLAEGYPLVKISFARAPAIVEELQFKAALNGNQEVPPASTRNAGFAYAKLQDQGERLSYRLSQSIASHEIQMAHLHLGQLGENGPVVAVLFDGSEGTDTGHSRASHKGRSRLRGDILTADLVGPLAGQPLDRLIAELQSGNIYVNVHTRRFPQGEIRGQLAVKY